jgi:hypothetical protein
MATQDDLLWEELSVLITSIDKLRREVARCVSAQGRPTSSTLR